MEATSKASVKALAITLRHIKAIVISYANVMRIATCALNMANNVIPRHIMAVILMTLDSFITQTSLWNFLKAFRKS